MAPILGVPGSVSVNEPVSIDDNAGSITIDAPTGPGAIQATTVNNKALISGVAEMLMSLESGSRGVDISSNMVLNGVDYSSFDGPFYEFQGDAVTGSGADLYMKWIHLKKMPKIFWSEDK